MKNVLVYGDVMVDRSWIVSGRTEATAQKHAAISPMRRIHPRYLDDSLGGAGMTACAVGHLCAGFCKVSLLAASGAIDGRVLGPVELIQIPRRHPEESVTTIKMRIYNINEEGLPALRHRFDQDSPSPDATDELPANLPSPSHLIISDFSKGAVRPSLLRSLLARFPDSEILVDTKDSALFDKCPELISRAGVLFINRDEATRLWELYRIPETDLDISLKLSLCLADLLEMGSIFLQKLPGWSIVVKLDQDGAVLFYNDHYYVQKALTASNTAGIGAGDVFLASWMQGVFLGAKDKGQLLAHATTTATTWVELAGKMNAWEKAWQAEREAPHCADIPVPPSLPDPFPSGCEINTGIENERARSTYPACIANGILDLRSAECGLGKFRVLNPSRRREVMRFVQRIREYLARGARTRPFNCILSASPGTGKSFLLKQLETPSLPFYEVNVAQFASSSEFMGELARIAAKGDRQRLLLIDEADTKLSGQHIYSLLLAPLWDGTVVNRGERLDLGLHFVSVLVTSTCKTPAEFRQSLEKAEKGPDLASRLNGADLKLIAPSGAADRIPLEEQANLDADYAVLIGSIVRRYYPNVRWVCRAFLDFLYAKQLSPRNLEYVLLRLESPGDAYIKAEDVAKLRLTFGETQSPTLPHHGSEMIQIVDES